MCHRVVPLLANELQEALDELHESGHARVSARDPHTLVPDAYPGNQVPLFVPGIAGELGVATLTWGFVSSFGGRSKTVFNTRIETALSQAQAGQGMWAEPIIRGRCLVPVLGFYESWTRAKQKPAPEVRFTLPHTRVFLLAGIYSGERFSLVTTVPNASVAPIHSRMPLVLGPGESSVWLGPNFAQLSDRSALTLTVTPEEASANPSVRAIPNEAALPSHYPE